MPVRFASSCDTSRADCTSTMLTPSTFSISRYARALIEHAVLCLKTMTGFFVESVKRFSSVSWLSILKKLFPIARHFLCDLRYCVIRMAELPIDEQTESAYCA